MNNKRKWHKADMKNRPYAPDEYFESIYKTYCSPFEKVSDKKSCEEASMGIKQKLREIFATEKIPFQLEKTKAETIKTESCKDYTLETLSVEICKGLKMLCYVLIPKKETKNGVVALCGHGYGCRQIIRRSKREKYRTINFLDNYQKNFALELAKNGSLVIVPEFIGFGQAKFKKDAWKPFYASSCDTISHHTLLYGFSTASLRIFQAMKCIDLLKDRYSCEAIGCMGISGGGLVALYTSCLDERIDKACICGYINTFKDSVLNMWHCPDNYIPGLLSVGEIYDFASCFAPKKLMMECGKNDKLFPISGSKKAIEHIEAVYKLWGAEKNFDPVVFEGKHEVSLKQAVEFFKE